MPHAAVRPSGRAPRVRRSAGRRRCARPRSSKFLLRHGREAAALDELEHGTRWPVEVDRTRVPAGREGEFRLTVAVEDPGSPLPQPDDRLVERARGDGECTTWPITCVSEVGLALPDVAAFRERFQREAGVDWSGEPPAEGFAAVGDDHGLLILVAEGRPWLPTRDRVATAAPVSIAARTPRACTVSEGVFHVTTVAD